MNVSMVNGIAVLPAGKGNVSLTEQNGEAAIFAPLLAAVQLQSMPLQTPEALPEAVLNEDKPVTDSSEERLNAILAYMPADDNVIEASPSQKNDVAPTPTPTPTPDTVHALAAASAVPLIAEPIATLDASTPVLSDQVDVTNDMPVNVEHSSVSVRDAVNISSQQTDGRFMLATSKSSARVEPPVMSDKNSEGKLLMAENMGSVMAENVVSTTHDYAHVPTSQPVQTTPASETLKMSSQAPTVIDLPQTTGSVEWERSLSQQLACFSRDGIHHAELRLHPEELGALQISMRMSNDRMQIHFVADNPQAHEALENALPHLRQSLADSGISLGQSSVGSEGHSSQMGQDSSGTTSSDLQLSNSGDAKRLDDVESEEIKLTHVNYQSGINTFA